MNDIKEIESIRFGILSPKEICDIAVCKIDNTKLSGSGSVYDERMGGNTDTNIPCVTCDMSPKDCPGHFGYIELNEYIIHPLFYKAVVCFLRCFCMQCNRLLITSDQIDICGLNRFKNERRFKKVLEKLEKVDICCHCDSPQSKIVYSIADNSISMVYKEFVNVDEEGNSIKKKDNKISVCLTIDEIKKSFDPILDEDVILCGFDPKHMHPRNLILSVFPVIPPCFLKDTIVYTNNGYKFIQDVLDCDKLFTHTGKFESINERHITKYTKGVIIEVSVSFHPNIIKCTPEHPFYVMRNVYNEAVWVSADDLCVSDYVGMKINVKKDIPVFNVPRNISFIKKSIDNILECYLLGYYLNKGSLDFNNKDMFYLEFNIEDDFIFKILNTLGVKYEVKIHNIISCEDFIYYYIMKEFGDIQNKKVPVWIQDAPCEYIREFLNGYNNNKKISRVYKDVVFSLQLLYIKLGYVYDVIYQQNDYIFIEDMYMIKEVGDSYFFKNEYVWFKVVKKDEVIYKDEVLVYNFDVANDHTYCVENLIVHNCARPYVLADGNVCDDDLTNQILEIIKMNNILKKEDNENVDEKKEIKKQKAIQSLKFRISTYYNNSQGKAKHPTNGRPIKGIKERLTGKEGQIRLNLMGKRCLAENSKIILWNGKIVNVQDVKVGDIIIGDDGLQRTVKKVFFGEDNMYKIKQLKGEDYVVNKSHILTLKYCNHKSIYKNSFTGEYEVSWFSIKSLSIKSKNFNTIIEANIFKDKIDNSDVFDIEIKDYLTIPENISRFLMGFKLHVPIKWCKVEVSLDPYILGMWLGNGKSSGCLTFNMKSHFTFIDIELINYLESWCDKYRYISVNKINIDPLTSQLEKYNLINNKYIPSEYIINDIDTRLKVLAGIIDTNGYVLKEGVICIYKYMKYKRLIDDTRFLASSLGFMTSVKIKKTSLDKNGKHKKGMCLVLTIYGNGIENIPTILSIKKCKASISKLSTSYSIKVIPFGVGKFYGFEIDDNNRFILRDFTVTHNCDYSGRTVIGPDPNLLFGWMAVPFEVARELTKPERVCVFNKNYLEKLVNEEKANFVVKSNGTKLNLKYAMFLKGTELLNGDIIIRGNVRISVINNESFLIIGDKLERNGNIMSGLKVGDVIIRGNEKIKVKNENFILRYNDKIERDGDILNNGDILLFPSKKYISLDIGDEVHRHLKDGDSVLLNRQPTLHKGSMMAMKVKVLSGKTFRMNLSTCKSYNADFDGDEMNIHVPQSLESVAELEELSAAKYNIISAQGSKPNITIVQDSLTGAFLMSRENKEITKSQFFDITMVGSMEGKSIYSPEKINKIIQVLISKNKKPSVYNGRGLLSLLFPDNFIYEKKNDAYPEEPILKIYRGVLYEGALDKTTLGASHNSLIQIIHKEYGVEVVSDFISNIQFITNNWLLVNGFSIGLEDCLIKDQDSVNKIQDKISMCYIEAGDIEENTHNPDIREIRVTAALSKAKDVGMKIAKNSMSPDNNFLSTVYSGSKGDFFNIAQLTGLLGQQNLLGKRVKPVLNNGKRTLPHYPFGKMDKEDEYESRGFVRHSFIEGLNPQEFFFHSMSGREGICDTAMGTAKSGYIQRRIIKVCEDIQVKYDGSVRDTTGKIYQLSYGDNGLDPCYTVKVNDKQQACDIYRITDKLNLEYELNLVKNSQKPIQDGHKPTQDNKKPTQDNKKPTQDNKKPTQDNKKPPTDGQKPPTDGQKPPTDGQKPIFRRIDILKDLHKVTGVKKLYKDLSDEELFDKLQNLKL